MLALRAGLIAGAVAGIVGILVNLPLQAPTDTYFNSASVMVVSLALGLGAGVLWRLLDRYTRRLPIFVICLVSGFAVVTIIAVVGETQIDRSVSYVVPLAAIVVGLTGVLTVLLFRARLTLSWWPVVLMFCLAVGLGIGLAGQGDQKSGKLDLPPKTTSAAPFDSLSSIQDIIGQDIIAVGGDGPD
jgi:hypothetical protein